MVSDFKEDSVKISLAVSASLLVFLALSALQAEMRTTPAEVKNPPAVVREQGASAARATNTINAQQSGEWKVEIAGTPTVNSPTLSQMVMPLSVDYQLTPGEVFSFNVICTGFREARVVLPSTSSSANLKVTLAFQVSGQSVNIAKGSFAGASQTVITGGNFQAAGNLCAFTVPCMSNDLKIQIRNDTGGKVTISRHCWVHLVN